MDDALGRCLDAVKTRVVDSCFEALASFQPRNWANACGMVQIALHLLKKTGLKAIQTDKDGGFAATTGEELIEARKDAVRSEDYQKVAIA